MGNKDYAPEHLVPIDTRKILQLMDEQRKQMDTLYDIMTLISDWQRDWKEEENKPVKMIVKR